MDHGDNRRGSFSPRTDIVLLVFLAVGAFYLVAEHRAHLLGVGPLLLLLGLCLVMHFFMHAGHGHGPGSDDGDPPPGGGREPGGHHH
ncbi:MAG: DUF2933 domain-containing protein [Salinarimonas sp.]